MRLRTDTFENWCEEHGGTVEDGKKTVLAEGRHFQYTACHLENGSIVYGRNGKKGTGQKWVEVSSDWGREAGVGWRKENVHFQGDTIETDEEDDLFVPSRPRKGLNEEVTVRNGRIVPDPENLKYNW